MLRVSAYGFTDSLINIFQNIMMKKVMWDLNRGLSTEKKYIFICLYVDLPTLFEKSETRVIRTNCPPSIW